MTLSGRGAAAAVVGLALLVAAAYEGYILAQQAYYDYVFYPRVKEGYIAPTRWQDIVALVLLWGIIAVLVSGGYRLLKYAFTSRREKQHGTVTV